MRSEVAMKTEQDHLALERRARVRAKDESLSMDQPLNAYTAVHAWVLIADPGAGKTDVFQTMSLAEGGHYTTARDFFLPGDHRSPLFIDGLDEVSASGAAGSTALWQIRSKLEALGTPKFRISCREADWRGNADGEALRRLVGAENFLELHLAPLTRAQSEALIAYWQSSDETAAKAFIREAENRDLEGLLDNPQTLRMLVMALAASGHDWPASKAQTYALACAQLVRESNDEHLAAQHDHALPDDLVLKAAGYLCAVMLLSGSSAIRMRRTREFTSGIVELDELPAAETAPRKTDHWAALRTRLFKGNGKGDFWPVHRTVAEYLGAQFLAERVRDGLPAQRVLALMLGEDGGVVPELRGLHAWLAALAPQALRSELIHRDPLGIVLYGDVRHFSRTEKLLVLQALRDEATRYTYFRNQNWASNPFGALATGDMADEFRNLLQSVDRSPPHLALLDCVIDALAHGHPMRELSPALEQVVRDKSYWSGLRTGALKNLVNYARNFNTWAGLSQLLADIHDNTVEDLEDELLGTLLRALYPGHIPPADLWRYFRRPKASTLIGTYYLFWHELAHENPRTANIPALLDALYASGRQIDSDRGDMGSAKVVGDLLVWAVEHHGLEVDVQHLDEWLSLGLGPHEHCPLDNDQKAALAQWLGEHPERYKQVFERGLRLSDAAGETGYSRLWKIRARLYGAREPQDAERWYLGLAEACPDAHVRLQLVIESFRLTQQRQGPDAAIQLIENWASAHPMDAEAVEIFLRCDYPPSESHQQSIDADLRQKNRVDEETRKRINFFRKTLSSFPAGPAHLGALAAIGETYLNFFRHSQAITPEARLSELLNHDPSWVSLALEGVRQCLFRDDLPSAEDIIDLHIKGQRYNMALPCLAAMALRHAENPQSALDLPPSILVAVAAFRLTHEYEETPAWYKQLTASHPDVLATVMYRLISQQIAASKEHPDGLNALAQEADYSEVARRITPRLITEFPSRANHKQLPSLRLLITSMLRFIDRKTQLDLIVSKVDASGMDVAQQTYWRSTGMLVAPDIYLVPFKQFIGKSQLRVGHMFALIHGLAHWDRSRFIASDEAQACLVELLGPRVGPRQWNRPARAHFVTPEMEMGEFVEQLISALAGSPDEAAVQALTALQQQAGMKAWSDQLSRALYDQTIVRRKAFFKPASVPQVCATLANLKPANAADLWALTVDHLTQLAREIRDGNTNDYGQYWAGDAPKIEDDCRNALLSDLKKQLAPLDIVAEPEGRYADQKRADIKVIAAPHHIPIEIKRESHRDLWKAIRDQLIAKYGRESASDGYGVFLVFWFTGALGAAPTDGGTAPKTPQELQQRLAATVPESLRHKIAVLVVDCSKP
jgi:hypothetical protein